MECDEQPKDRNYLTVNDPNSSVNSVILDYYKKFGRKRDLEQYFSLSTTQSDIRDPTSLFWKNMKALTDSSDSGDKDGSSKELCRISIKCTLPDSSEASKSDNIPATFTENDRDSPPIITECQQVTASKNTDDDSVKSDDNHSQKSLDMTLDTSLNKPLSPTSSITSQRKLEWDSLADVGYANESDRKTSASSLSTLERLALKQQCYGDTNQDPNIGVPTAQSTPYEIDSTIPKSKKGISKKTTKIIKQSKDEVELSVPEISNPKQGISINLTKHISFNMEKASGEKNSFNNYENKTSIAGGKQDKEIQTTLKSYDESKRIKRTCDGHGRAVPIFVSLNTLKRKHRKKKFKITKRKLRQGQKINVINENSLASERNVEAVSEAESFEYMPGHVYNQNKLKAEHNIKTNCIAENKSSLESSGAFATDSTSKSSKQSFTKDLQKSIDLLKIALQQRYNEPDHKKKLIKEVVKRLLTSHYRDDDSSTNFLAGLNLNSKQSSTDNHYTTSTSENTNSFEKQKLVRPKKSILRHDKTNTISSLSKSVPNLLSVSQDDKYENILKLLTTNNTDSDMSSKVKVSTDPPFKTSSEELYQKYLEALRREESYKKHLKNKENLLKQKLASPETKLQMNQLIHLHNNQRLNDLMKDLTRNNYDDGSGDASKLEGGSSSYLDLNRNDQGKKQKSHSVFTLSSCNSEKNVSTSKKKKRKGNEINNTEQSDSNNHKHYCCCPYHSGNVGKVMIHTSAQVDVTPRDKVPKECQISAKTKDRESSAHISYNFKCFDRAPTRGEKRIFECTHRTEQGLADVKLPNNPKTVGIEENKATTSKQNQIITKEDCVKKYSSSDSDYIPLQRHSKCSQTSLDLPLKISQGQQSDKSYASWSSEDNKIDHISRIRNISDLNLNDNLLSNALRSQYEQSDIIKECTRCIQTDISINPKISNPSLSDIQLISNDECTKLIKETFKKVSQSSSACQSRDVGTVSSGTTNEGENNSVSTGTKILSKPIFPNRLFETVPDASYAIQNNNGTPDNYTIPLAGTNMTLMVRINQCKHENHTTHDDGTLTDKNVVDKCTSLSQASKIVQSTSANNVENINGEKLNMPQKSLASIHCDCNNLRDKPSELALRETLENDQNKRHFFASEFKFARNTYPPVDPCNGKKLLRSNSDTYCGTINSTEKINKATEIYSSDFVPKSDILPFRDNIKLCKSIETIHKTNVCERCFQTNCLCSDRLAATDNSEKINLNVPDLVENKAKIQNHVETSDHFVSHLNVGSQTINTNTDVDNKKDIADRKNVLHTVNASRKTNFNPTDEGKLSKMYLTSSRSSKSNSPRRQSSKHSPLRSTSPTKTIKNIASKDLVENPNITKTQKSCSVSKSGSPRCKSPSVPSSRLGSPRKIIMNDAPNASAENLYSDSMKHNPDYENPRFTVNIMEDEGKIDLLRTRRSSTSSDKHILKNYDRIKLAETLRYATSEEVNPNSNGSSYKSSNKNDLASGDPILDMIQGITNRYSKQNFDKKNKKKCFKRIMNVLNYLLDTEETTDQEQINTEDDTHKTEDKEFMANDEDSNTKHISISCQTNQIADKSANTSFTRVSKHRGMNRNSSDFLRSSEMPTTSTDSGTCKVLNKIKRECEKYHQKRCKCYHGRGKTVTSSSTTVDCAKCNRTHTCGCRPHRSKSHSKHMTDKNKKTNVAYNLIIQPSDSMMNDESNDSRHNNCHQLKNVIIKVPSRRRDLEKLPFNEVASKLEKCSQRSYSRATDKSEISGAEDKHQKIPTHTVRDYLEKNRPDFVEQCTQRQNCLNFISQSRSHERSSQRKLLSLQLERLSSVKDKAEFEQLAAEIGANIRRKNPAAKLISERDMKKHSEKIYKSLPEVVQKKEIAKKENMKMTNLLMASIFKRNLQKKALRGSINLSNYCTVVKI